MRELRLSTVGAVCALIAVAGFAAGVALMATNGVSVLIPETGKEGAEWVADVQDAGDWFVVTTAVDDPTYLAQQFVTSSNFKKEANDSKWNPTPCKTS